MAHSPRPWWIKWFSSHDPRNLLRRILKRNDPPHCIAIGVAVGVFIGLTPTVGLQTALLVGVGFLVRQFVRFNELAALAGVFVSNPLTVIPIYWIDYQVGRLIFGGEATWDQVLALLQYGSFDQWWIMVESVFEQVGLPLFAGALVVATIGAGLSYPVARSLVVTLRQSHSATAVRRQCQRIARLLGVSHCHE